MHQVIENRTINTMDVYSAIGPVEYHLLKRNDFMTFPVRSLKFYPRNYADYATYKAGEISKSAEKGFVLKTKVNVKLMTHMPLHHVATSDDYVRIDAGSGIIRRGYHGEYQLDAVHVDRLNANIVGKIHVIEVFYDGDDITDYICYKV